MKQKYWLPLLISIAMVAGLWIGNLLSPNHREDTQSKAKLERVLSLIEDKYVDDVDLDSLIEMAIPSLLRNLDPHSSYISAASRESANSEIEGKFSGIGISFSLLNDTLSVLEVITGGPAEKVGVLPGDRIIQVDDNKIAGKHITENDVFSMLRGEKGTHVTITVKRSNTKQPITFEITRDDIPVESIDAAYMIEPEVGYIKIARFGRNTYPEFLQAVSQLSLEGAKNFVVDLRYNGGGLMESALLMANEFMDPYQTIVSTRGRNQKEDNVVLSDGTGAFKEYGLAVLVNELTASASEILAGAIQDNDRGWIVGRRTFGKGLVQEPILLPDSSEMRLTIQRYFTPSGRCIQKDYKPGDIDEYDAELINRFTNGENLNADSIKQNTERKYLTAGGREVYGGGGIMPDIFVPEDTAHITSYYVNVANQNLLMKFAYDYADLNRDELQHAKDVESLLKMLPSNQVLLNSFVNYASMNGVPARWYYIDISSPLIVNQLKALIARNILGFSAYWQVLNQTDTAVKEAVKHAKMPVPTSQEPASE